MSVEDDAAARLADVGAQTLVATATTDGYPWLLGRVTDALGEQYATLLERSRARLLGLSMSAAARAEEVSVWRWRLHDAVTGRPELATGLRGVVDEAAVRLILATPTATRRRATPHRDPALEPVGQATAAGPASAPRALLFVAILLIILAAGSFAAWTATGP